jgi:hypothetical protein
MTIGAGQVITEVTINCAAADLGIAVAEAPEVMPATD